MNNTDSTKFTTTPQDPMKYIINQLKTDLAKLESLYVGYEVLSSNNLDKKVDN